MTAYSDCGITEAEKLLIILPWAMTPVPWSGSVSFHMYCNISSLNISPHSCTITLVLCLEHANSAMHILSKSNTIDHEFLGISSRFMKMPLDEQLLISFTSLTFSIHLSCSNNPAINIEQCWCHCTTLTESKPILIISVCMPFGIRVQLAIHLFMLCVAIATRGI